MRAVNLPSRTHEWGGVIGTRARFGGVAAGLTRFVLTVNVLLSASYRDPASTDSISHFSTQPMSASPGVYSRVFPTYIMFQTSAQVSNQEECLMHG